MKYLSQGSGFIGSHVVDALIKNGHEILIYDLEPPASANHVTMLLPM
jgi:nucleoside-diphosphate-sugar epimerase